MLRSGVVAVAAIAFLGGLCVLVAHAFPPAWVFVFWGALILLGTVWEKVRYKDVAMSAPGAPFVRTSERFVDPASGRALTVYINPATGERSYVAD